MKKKRYALMVAILCVVVMGSLGGLSFYNLLHNNKQHYESNLNNNDIGDESKNEEKEKTYDELLDEKSDKVLSSMSLKEKILSLFILECDNLHDNGETVTLYDESVKNKLNEYPVGGIILFADNIVDRQQVINLNNEIQKNSRIPMFIGVDEEGGKVSRIASNKKMGTTKFESMKSIGDSGDMNKAYEVGETIGREIYELGFNLDFAPDSDVLTNPDNVEIGTRSFGSDPNLVADMAVNTVKGLQENNVCAVMKHFPGHGASSANSHNQYTYTPQDLENMRKVEFLPFKKGIDFGVDFILVSHIAAPNVTGDKTPSTLSRKIVNDILRNELNYDGVVITDALNMKAVSSYYTEEKMYIKALEAGCDMLLMPQNIDKAYESILNAYNDGTISEERIDKSVKRILKAKLRRNIIKEGIFI